MVDEDSHSTDLSVSGEEGHSTIITFYGFIENKVIFSDAGYTA